MIFVSGIHGVGKDYFLKNVKDKLGIKSYSASELIEKYGNVNIGSNKRTQDIKGNQDYLLAALKSKKLPKEYILNGHFCLLNSKGIPERIPIETFYNLNPSKIIVLIEKPEIIAVRRIIRDNVEVSVEATEEFQKEEVSYAKELAKKLGVPIGIFNSMQESKKAIKFISSGLNKTKILRRKEER